MQVTANENARSKVLIIDDDETISKVVSSTLKAEGYRVFMAGTGQEGIEVFNQEDPDLVVLDLMLPDIDGYDVCFNMRRESSVPILILSAKTDELDKVVGFRMGVDDYVTKPFSPTELVLRVKAILRRAKHARIDKTGQSRVVFGDLAVDLQKREVLIGKTLVNLTTKEFDLLWFLATHPNRVFTREELSHKIWEDYYAGNPGTINVLVCRLRDKIEKNPAHPQYISTVWGVGYKFVTADPC